MENKQNKREEWKEKKQGRLAYRLLALFLLTAGCIVFEILTIRLVKEGFIVKNMPWILGLSIGATALLLGLGIFLLVTGREKSYKLIITIFFLLLFFLIVLFIVIKTDFIVVLQSPELYQKFLEKTGAWMPVLYILFQLLQVVILPVPSLVSTLAGLALFGPLKTAVYSLIGILAGSFTGFVIGRKLGYKAVAWLVGEEDLKRWLQKVKGKDNLALTLMFILPLFPDDVLCFISGLSTMSFRYFSLMVIISRGVGILATCYSFELIPFNTWWGLSIWVAIFLVGIIVFIILYKNLDKINGWLKRKKFFKNSKKR